jgi:transcriptional regulator with XRE-family HTH domain
MHVACHLREIRGDRSLQDIADVAGVNRGALSDIERGFRLPHEDWVERLEEAYGEPPERWYPDFVLLTIERSGEERSK